MLRPPTLFMGHPCRSLMSSLACSELALRSCALLAGLPCSGRNRFVLVLADTDVGVGDRTQLVAAAIKDRCLESNVVIRSRQIGPIRRRVRQRYDFDDPTDRASASRARNAGVHDVTQRTDLDHAQCSVKWIHLKPEWRRRPRGPRSRDVIGHAVVVDASLQPASSTAIFLSRTRSRRSQGGSPEPRDLPGAFSHEGRRLTPTFGSRPAARGSDDSVGCAKPHAHKRVLFGPWIFHQCFHVSWNEALESEARSEKKGLADRPPLCL